MRHTGRLRACAPNWAPRTLGFTPVRTGVLTREYPPEIYGGAGVHVAALVPRLRELVDVEVHCFGGPREDAVNAITAVSHGMRADVLDCYPKLAPARVHVVHNGIDTDYYRPVASTDVLVEHGIDPALPIVVFVGRITRQKGVGHLVAAA